MSECEYMWAVEGTAAAAPPPFRPSEPAVCESHPLVTPYNYRLRDLLCLKADDLYRGSMQSEDHRRTALQYNTIYLPCSMFIGPYAAANNTALLAWRPLQGTKLYCLMNRGTLGVNNLPRVVARTMPRSESNPRPLDHESNALPLHHRVTSVYLCMLFCVCMHMYNLCFLCVFCVVFLYSFLLQYFDAVGRVFWPVKIVSHITYTVLAGT